MLNFQNKIPYDKSLYLTILKIPFDAADHTYFYVCYRQSVDKVHSTYSEMVITN